MDPKTYDQLTRAFDTEGTDAALGQLLNLLRKEKDYHRLFDALLLRARHDLKMPLIQSAPSSELPETDRTAYEDRVIEACREVGGLLLQASDIGAAYQYFHMIGELEPVRDAIDRFKPSENDENLEAVIEVALQQAVHPAKGLALVLDRYGTCQSITACQQVIAQPIKPAAREECVKLLVRRLHAELIERLAAEIEAREGKAPAAPSIRLLMQGRDWLMGEDNYHIDTSHLNSVVRMARLLPKCDELALAVQLCEYGARLSERYRYPEPAPFEEIYSDSLVYFRAIHGQEVEAGLEHFKRKAETANPDDGSYPAEVYIHLLQRMGRMDEAIAYAGRKLNRGGTTSFCPTVNELCQAAGKFDDMAKLARKRDDVVSFAAGLAQRKRA